MWCQMIATAGESICGCPGLALGESEKFSVALHLETGDHRILVAVDAVGDIIEPEGDRGNNRAWLNTTIA